MVLPTGAGFDLAGTKPFAAVRGSGVASTGEVEEKRKSPETSQQRARRIAQAARLRAGKVETGHRGVSKTPDAKESSNWSHKDHAQNQSGGDTKESCPRLLRHPHESHQIHLDVHAPGLE